MMNEDYFARPAKLETEIYNPDPGPMEQPNTPYLNPYAPTEGPHRTQAYFERPSPAPNATGPAQDPLEVLETLWARLLDIEYQADGLSRRLPEVPEQPEPSAPSAQEILDLQHLTQAIAPPQNPEPEIKFLNTFGSSQPNLEELIEGEFQSPI